MSDYAIAAAAATGLVGALGLAYLLLRVTGLLKYLPTKITK